MAFDPATTHNRPLPPGEADQARWEESALRNRLLHGEWREDARRVLQKFFHPDVFDFLPPAVLAFNPFKGFTTQTATLYEGGAEAVSLHFRGRRPSASAVHQLGLEHLWAQQEETLINVLGMKDCYLRRSWSAKRGQVAYRVVTADCVWAVASEEDPQQPDQVWELRKRRGIAAEGFRPDREYWCWDVWDLSEGEPRFQILFQVDDDEYVDLTRVLLGEAAAAPGAWPYWTEGAPGEGEPIWPWTAYHHKISHRLHDPRDGVELVDGTLIIATLWTFWVGGFRDVAWGQPWMMDADVAGARVDKSGGGQSYVTSSPLHWLKLISTGDPGSKGTVGQLGSRMDPASAAEAVSGFAASLALYAGLSPADVSIGNSGLSRTSGFAIEVSRDGKYRVERRILAPMRLGDQHNLAGAAQLANAYGPSSSPLPTEADAYRPVYPRTGRTSQEVRDEVESIRALREAGLLHPRDAIRRLRPELTDEDAEAEAIRIARFEARLEAIRTGREDPEADPDEVPEPVDASNRPERSDDTIEGDDTDGGPASPGEVE